MHVKICVCALYVNLCMCFHGDLLCASRRENARTHVWYDYLWHVHSYTYICVAHTCINAYACKYRGIFECEHLSVLYASHLEHVLDARRRAHLEHVLDSHLEVSWCTQQDATSTSVQHTTARRNKLQHAATRCDGKQDAPSSLLQHTTTCCNMLQHALTF